MNGCLPSRTRRSGFVLVMVLVLITLAGLSVAGFARTSLDLARRVAEAEENLQRRWATKSAQRFLLNASGTILDRGLSTDVEVSWPRPHQLDGQFSVGDLTIDFRLSDEEAKANLNAIGRRETNPTNRLTTVARTSAGTSGLTAMVRWPETSKSQNFEGAGLQTWEQVFDLSDPLSADDLAARLKSGTNLITCWGSGKLNLKRAPDEAVRALFGSELRPEFTRNLLNVRSQGDFQSLKELAGKMELKPGEESALTHWFSLESKTNSLWMTVATPRRTWTSLTIDRSGEGNSELFDQFTW